MITFASAIFILILLGLFIGCIAVFCDAEENGPFFILAGIALFIFIVADLGAEARTKQKAVEVGAAHYELVVNKDGSSETKFVWNSPTKQ